MSAASARGFTLIEVVGAVFAFVIAFLAGSATFARLLQQQNLNYQRTLAASAAMLLTDWHADQSAGDFVGNTAGIGGPLRSATPGGTVTWRGGDRDGANDVIYVFNTFADGVDLTLYNALVVAVSQASAQEADSHVSWRQLSFYYGSVATFESPHDCSLEYVGRYLVPDQVTP